MRLSPRLSRWLLPLSLALNVFLATLAVMRPPFPPPRHGPPPSPAHIAERIAQTLPAADGAVLRQVFAVHAAEMERNHALIHALPDRVRAILAAPALDEAALKAAMADNRDAHAAMDDALAQVIVETATRLSPEGRAALARWDPRPPHPPGGPPPGPRP